ncbi:hypothetical protein M3Y94_00947500 [Aphelenchoides besseyi]|nr:hypothetical protein M3Y94_00947500 [Aphelenchoides besseyi]KAI6224841.1 TP53RK-binding protein [Aphelenchoides besseyi]
MTKDRSHLYALQPDPYDETQRRYLRVCLFQDVKNSVELRELLRNGKIDAAMIRAELVLEPFILLAAANRAVHQAAHNRMFTRSLSAELIYSLSPTRNISDSLNAFGIAENSKVLIVAVFDDEKGSKMSKIVKKVDGTAVTIDNLSEVANLQMIKKVYQVSEPDVVGESMSDLIITKLVTKDLVL